ncbi:MAG: hypothetical protein WB820_09300 [Rhodoplanes sp.]
MPDEIKDCRELLQPVVEADTAGFGHWKLAGQHRGLRSECECQRYRLHSYHSIASGIFSG